MNKAFSYICALLWVLSFAFVAQGQDLDGWNDEEQTAEDNYASNELDVSRPKIFSAAKSIGKNQYGYALKRYLMIEYPWSKIQNATLEVRIIGPEAEKQPQFCKPVFFMTVYGKLEKIDKDIYNKKMGAPSSRDNIEYSSSLFHEFGLPEPKSLELATMKPLSGARADFFHLALSNPDTGELETTLIYHDLTQWAADDNHLVIELRGKAVTDAEGKKVKEIEFEKPCKIKIWLLHDDYVVWEETFQWPGTEKDNSKKVANKKPRAQKADDDEDPREAAKSMENANKNQKKDNQKSEDEEMDADFSGFDDDF